MGQAARQKPRAARTSDSERDMFISLFKAGYRPSEIATNMTRSMVAVCTAISNAGYNPQRHTYADAEADSWAKKYNGDFDGYEWSVAAIERLTGHGWATVALALSARGCRLRHRSKAATLAHLRAEMMDE